MADDELRQFLSRLTRRDDLTYDEASRLVDALLSEDCSDAHIAAILIALSTKGETTEELAGMAAALRARATQLSPSTRRLSTRRERVQAAAKRLMSQRRQLS